MGGVADERNVASNHRPWCIHINRVPHMWCRSVGGRDGALHDCRKVAEQAVKEAGSVVSIWRGEALGVELRKPDHATIAAGHKPHSQTSVGMHELRKRGPDLFREFGVHHHRDDFFDPARRSGMRWRDPFAAS